MRLSSDAGLTIGGFTLIEIMVAVGILSISLTALVGINTASLKSTTDIRFYVIATQLARLRMVEFEYKINKDGFGTFDEYTEEGDFSEEEFPDFKWKIEVNKVELNIVGNVPSGQDNQDQSANLISGYSSFITDIIKNIMREVKLTVTVEDESGYVNEMKVATHLIDRTLTAQNAVPATQ